LHGGQASAQARPSLPAVAAALGFRRVERVEVVVGEGAATATCTGIVHRYPRTVPISMASAGWLTAAGAPLRVVQADPTEAGPW
jgi:hypothetical protein